MGMTLIRVSGLDKGYSGKVAAICQVSLEVQAGELLALAGESGSGKSTLLRLIAGLELPDRGIIEIDGVQVAGPGRFVEPQHRNVGLVFQDYALFPHMTVLQNTMFGLKEWSSSDRKRRVAEVLALVGLESLTSRYPHQLSGGQQQRVAIARALAPKPQIILLDEPFSSLDTSLKDQVRIEVKNIIKESQVTAVLVTHDIQDALSTADRIALLKDGSLQQVDTPKRLYNYPVNKYVAGFFGKVNFLATHYQEDKLCTPLCELPIEEAPIVTEGLLCVRPQDLHVSITPPGIKAKVVEINYLGNSLQLQVKAEDHLLWCYTTEMSYQRDQEVYLELKLSQPHVIKDENN